MRWRLKLKNFGKIRDAEIHNSSMRFFVGDNNSGKSYLMMLLWGLDKYFFKRTDYPIDNLGCDFSSWISEEQFSRFFTVKGTFEFSCLDFKDVFNSYIQRILHNEKDKLVSMLFNSSKVSIGKIWMEFDFDENDKFGITLEDDPGPEPSCSLSVYVNSPVPYNDITYIGSSDVIELNKNDKVTLLNMIVQTLFEYAYRKNQDGFRYGRKIYMPAARTGFVLTKDIINQVSRRNTFAYEGNRVSRRNTFAHEGDRYEPFPMPIMEFLDDMDAIQYGEETQDLYAGICKMIEDKMLQGHLTMDGKFNKSLEFMPIGSDAKLPLRATSAVVTEMLPLYALLKWLPFRNSILRHYIPYRKPGLLPPIDSIYYEEPEMCLHPSLQQIMARVLIHLANVGICLTVTTHSDLILQHVNNMFKLGKSSQRDELMEQFDYRQEDLLDGLDVSVYQFDKNQDGTTSLKELSCGEYGFEVPTFNHTLDKLLEEVYAFQGEDE